MSLLDSKVVLVTGVLTDSSIAFHVARRAQQEGAFVILTSFGRSMRITQAIARRLPRTPPIVELDVTDETHLATLADRLAEHTDRVDGVVHAVAFAPDGAFTFLTAPWPAVATALHVSTYSLPALVRACLPLMTSGGSVVGLTFDGSVAWRNYDWMGVAKAALEAANRYCARDVGPAGVRCNLVSAGPLRTPAAKAIPSDGVFAGWSERAPLGWDCDDIAPVADVCVSLLGDHFRAMTGAIVPVDGGHHAMGE